MTSERRAPLNAREEHVQSSPLLSQNLDFCPQTELTSLRQEVHKLTEMVVGNTSMARSNLQDDEVLTPSMPSQTNLMSYM